ncbi:MAG: hypothetical protein RIB45_06055 [Marivibrio sp.]|uniref:hypothetical protein n=1 Tax=Marivibrio sp. TaxID=2039719 RepID=UPI0032F06D87
MDDNPLAPPAFFHSAEPIRPRSKVPRNKVPGVCLGFCQSVSVPHVAKRTGLSVKTVRELYKAIRALLLEPRYRKWHALDRLPIYEFTNGKRIEKEIWRAFGECYSDDECFRNYRYGKRSSRQCRNCPAQQSDLLQAILTPEIVDMMLQRIDTIRAYYQVLLGLSREKGQDQTELFRQRAYHVEIILTAQKASMRIDNGVVQPDMLARGPMTLNELWLTILHHIEERGKL